MVEPKNVPPDIRRGKPKGGTLNAPSNATGGAAVFLNVSGHVFHKLQVQNNGSVNLLVGPDGSIGTGANAPVVIVPGAAQLFTDVAPNEIFVAGYAATCLVGWVGYGRHFANETDT
jgi:hypothetical protein